jgi:hypothetical protein
MLHRQNGGNGATLARLERDSEIDERDLDADLGQVVRVGQLGGDVQPA